VDCKGDQGRDMGRNTKSSAGRDLAHIVDKATMERPPATGRVRIGGKKRGSKLFVWASLPRTHQRSGGGGAIPRSVPTINVSARKKLRDAKP